MTDNQNPIMQAPQQGTAVAIPSYLQDAQQKFGGLDLGGGGIPRVSLHNNNIALVVGGAITHSFGQSADVIIVGAMPGVGRMYYDQPYNAGGDEVVLPACWSTDGNKAHDAAPRCPSPNRACAGCPMNVAGSASNGQAKACQYVKALALVFPNDPNPGTVYRMLAKGGTLFGQDNPAQNLFNLKNLSAFMQTHNVPLGGMVFTMSIDVASPTPSKVLFTPKDWVPEDFYKNVLQQIPDEKVDEAASLDFERAWAMVQQKQAQQQQAPVQPQQPPVQPQPAPMMQPVAEAPAQVQGATEYPPAQQATPVQPLMAAQPVQPQPVQPQPVQPQPAQTEQQPAQAAPANPTPTQDEQVATEEDLQALLQRFQEKGAGQL